MNKTSRFAAKIKFKNALNLMSLMTIMVCSFVGAGFVSGAEIYEFFSRFKSASYIGAIVFFFLSFLLCYKVLKMSTEKQIYFDSNIEPLYKNSKLKMYKNNNTNNKNTFLNKNFIKNIIIFCNCFFISGAMVAGLKNLIFKLYFKNYIFIFFACITFVFILCLIGVRGLDKIDILVLGFVAMLCFVFVTDNSYGIITSLKFDFSSFSLGLSTILSSIFFASLYVFMNILQFEPVVSSFGLNLSKRGALIFSLLFALFLSLPLFCFILFLNCNNWLTERSMPFLDFFIVRGGFLSKIFGLGLLICLLTTLITCLIGLKSKIKNKFHSMNFTAATISLVMVLLISILPFKFFVSILYPILGVLNFVVFVFL